MLLFDLYLGIFIKVVWLIMSVALTILIIKIFNEEDTDESLEMETKNEALEIELKNDAFDFIFNTEEEALACLEFLINCTQRYGEVSRLDLYEYLEFETSYPDIKVGWKDLTTTEVVPFKNGYRLSLPKFENLFGKEG